jgi:addiction module RelB/DinJ family antitoxin
MKTLKQSSILIRIPLEKKEKITAVFDGMGITMTQAINLFFTACEIEHALPFKVRSVSDVQSKFNKILFSLKLARHSAETAARNGITHEGIEKA